MYIDVLLVKKGSIYGLEGQMAASENSSTTQHVVGRTLGFS